MANTQNDAKQAVDSSPPASQTPGRVEALDLAEHEADTESLPVEKGVDQGSPPDERPEKSIVDVAREALNKKTDETVEPEPEPEVEKPEEKETEEKPEGTETPEGDEDLPPFHEHPRWQEMIRERDELKTRLDQLKPLVDHVSEVQSYRQRFNITDDQFNQALEVVALMNTDPMKATAKLRETLQGLESFTGERLAPDLQEAVDSGVIDPQHAKEIMTLRGQLKVKELEGQNAVRTAAQRQHEAVVLAMRDWDTSKRGTDPDFHPRTNGTLRGKYELVKDALAVLWQEVRPANAAEAIKLAEQAYDEVTQSIARFAGVKPEKKVLVGRVSPTVTKAAPVIDPNDPNWALKVARRVMNRRGR